MWLHKKKYPGILFFLFAFSFCRNKPESSKKLPAINEQHNCRKISFANLSTDTNATFLFKNDTSYNHFLKALPDSLAKDSLFYCDIAESIFFIGFFSQPLNATVFYVINKRDGAMELFNSNYILLDCPNMVKLNSKSFIVHTIEHERGLLGPKRIYSVYYKIGLGDSLVQQVSLVKEGGFLIDTTTYNAKDSLFFVNNAAKIFYQYRNGNSVLSDTVPFDDGIHPVIDRFKRTFGTSDDQVIVNDTIQSSIFPLRVERQ